MIHRGMGGALNGRGHWRCLPAPACRDGAHGLASVLLTCPDDHPKCLRLCFSFLDRISPLRRQSGAYTQRSLPLTLSSPVNWKYLELRNHSVAPVFLVVLPVSGKHSIAAHRCAFRGPVPHLHRSTEKHRVPRLAHQQETNLLLACRWKLPPPGPIHRCDLGLRSRTGRRSLEFCSLSCVFSPAAVS